MQPKLFCKTESLQQNWQRMTISAWYISYVVSINRTTRFRDISSWYCKKQTKDEQHKYFTIWTRYHSFYLKIDDTKFVDCVNTLWTITTSYTGVKSKQLWISHGLALMSHKNTMHLTQLNVPFMKVNWQLVILMCDMLY